MDVPNHIGSPLCGSRKITSKVETFVGRFLLIAQILGHSQKTNSQNHKK